MGGGGRKLARMLTGGWGLYSPPLLAEPGGDLGGLCIERTHGGGEEEVALCRPTPYKVLEGGETNQALVKKY